MVGVMYCSTPMVDSGMRRAPAENSSSGTAVTGPLSANSSQVCASCAGRVPLCWPQSRAAAATGAVISDIALAYTSFQTTAATGKQPSAALAAVIGEGAVSRPEVVKKLWDYIKANGLQDAADKRKVNADAKLRPVFGKDQVTMFEIAGIVGQHLVD